MSDLSINNLNQSNDLFTKDGTSYSIQGKKGPYLVFIHGVGLCKEIWEPQVKYFSQNYRVITYDFIGHGLSPVLKKNPELDDYVSQLNELVESINLSNFSLIGHSMGALISVAFSLKHQNKVNALIPLNIVFNRTISSRNDVLMSANLFLKTGKISNIEQTLERWFKNKASINEIKKINKVRQLLNDVSPKGYGDAYKLFAQSDSLFENKLSGLKLPVLYLTGSDDPNSTSRMSQEMASASSNGHYESIDNEAHMVAYISPGKVNPIIENFLLVNSK